MIDTVGSRRAQYLNSLQHISIPGVNRCSFDDPAQVYQQFDMRLVQVLPLLQELECVLLGAEQV